MFGGLLKSIFGGGGTSGQSQAPTMVNNYSGPPEWYTDMLRAELLNPAVQESKKPYMPYEGERIAPFTPDQQQAQDLLRQEVTGGNYDQPYQQSQQSLLQALQSNPLAASQPYFDQGTASSAGLIDNYMNPYQERVLDQIAKRGQRNLEENLLPALTSKAVSMNRFGGGRYDELARKLARDVNENVLGQQAGYLSQGYDKALSAAQNEQIRNLQAGQVTGILGQTDATRQAQTAQALQDSANRQQQQRMAAAQNLNVSGAGQQAQQQTGMNLAYQQSQEKQNYPKQQLSDLNALMRGQTLPMSTTQVVTPLPTPGQSPYTGAGSVLGQMGSLAAAKPFAEGGKVRRDPIREGGYAAREAIDSYEMQLMRKRADKLREAPDNAFPYYMAKMFAGLGKHGGVKGVGNMQALAMGGGEGVDAFIKERENAVNTGNKAVDIYQAIDNTRRWQEQQQTQNALAERTQGATERYQTGQLGLEREKLALLKDTLAQKAEAAAAKNNKMSKVDEDALKEAQDGLKTVSGMKKILAELGDLSSRLNTGPILGDAARRNSTLGSLAGVGKQADIESFNNLTSNLILAMRQQLKGSQIAMSLVDIIEQTKPGLDRSPEGNTKIIKDLSYLTDLAEMQDGFIVDSVGKKKRTAAEATKIFNKYADARLKAYQEGQPFDLTVDQFAELASLSDEQLEQMLQAQQNG